MPMLDVGFIAMDPMTADVFAVIRREERISPRGRNEIYEDRFERVRGTITIEKPDSLEREDGGQTASRAISVITRFQLINAAKDTNTPEPRNFQPDIIEWQGVQYTVIDVQPYPRFGRGFYQARALSMQAVDPIL